MPHQRHQSTRDMLNLKKACKEAANKIIPLKPKLKKRTPWETAEICQKRDILRKLAKLKDTRTQSSK